MVSLGVSGRDLVNDCMIRRNSWCLKIFKPFFGTIPKSLKGMSLSVVTSGIRLKVNIDHRQINSGTNLFKSNYT